MVVHVKVYANHRDLAAKRFSLNLYIDGANSEAKGKELIKRGNEGSSNKDYLKSVSVSGAVHSTAPSDESTGNHGILVKQRTLIFQFELLGMLMIPVFLIWDSANLFIYAFLALRCEMFEQI